MYILLIHRFVQFKFNPIRDATITVWIEHISFTQVNGADLEFGLVLTEFLGFLFQVNIVIVGLFLILLLH